MAPGDPLPSERVLAEQFGINRHAVREAIKRLQQAGLVVVSQGAPPACWTGRCTAGWTCSPTSRRCSRARRAGRPC
ncbi:winged helix-turn-helix domain-containing protein [Svornostia abyssi]|uniref:Winged helix-turn-helix domain-containing protein n=1 Tax=Svornostia abyssi TaxID=2898438 RepID=A0ABY5PP09_9ACTN|nr:winged helix-turn-helix domain-containing protein [Parviterribacteraceae bacterium J379]